MEAEAQAGVPGTIVFDRRCGSRRGVLKNALVVFNNGHCTMSCRILDVTDTGAKLMPADVLTCPGEFVLKPQIGEARHCEVVWRRGQKMGVRFV